VSSLERRGSRRDGRQRGLRDLAAP
jgi:hypothetical protein